LKRARRHQGKCAQGRDLLAGLRLVHRALRHADLKVAKPLLDEFADHARIWPRAIVMAKALNSQLCHPTLDALEHDDLDSSKSAIVEPAGQYCDLIARIPRGTNEWNHTAVLVISG
jgi:hypothetical protein